MGAPIHNEKRGAEANRESRTCGVNVNTTDANGATALSLPCGALGRRQFSNGGFTLERSFSMAERAGMIPEHNVPERRGEGCIRNPHRLSSVVCACDTPHTRQHDNTTTRRSN